MRLGSTPCVRPHNESAALPRHSRTLACVLRSAPPRALLGGEGWESDALTHGGVMRRYVLTSLAMLVIACGGDSALAPESAAGSYTLQTRSEERRVGKEGRE